MDWVNRLRGVVAELTGGADADSEGEYRCIRCGNEFDKNVHTCPTCGGEFVGPAEERNEPPDAE